MIAGYPLPSLWDEFFAHWLEVGHKVGTRIIVSPAYDWIVLHIPEQSTGIGGQK